jgi:hypothetical protein
MSGSSEWPRASTTLPAMTSLIGRRRVVGTRRRGGALAGARRRRWATGFVEQQLGVLEAHDRLHGTTLERVLELALDHSDRGAAADAAFMHRNTFRRQLKKALELLGSDLDFPRSDWRCISRSRCARASRE